MSEASEGCLRKSLADKAQGLRTGHATLVIVHPGILQKDAVHVYLGPFRMGKVRTQRQISSKRLHHQRGMGNGPRILALAAQTLNSESIMDLTLFFPYNCHCPKSPNMANVEEFPRLVC